MKKSYIPRHQFLQVFNPCIEVYQHYTFSVEFGLWAATGSRSSCDGESKVNL